MTLYIKLELQCILCQVFDSQTKQHHDHSAEITSPAWQIHNQMWAMHCLDIMEERTEMSDLLECGENSFFTLSFAFKILFFTRCMQSSESNRDSAESSSDSLTTLKAHESTSICPLTVANAKIFYAYKHDSDEYPGCSSRKSRFERQRDLRTSVPYSYASQKEWPKGFEWRSSDRFSNTSSDGKREIQSLRDLW